MNLTFGSLGNETKHSMALSNADMSPWAWRYPLVQRADGRKIFLLISH